ncbi:MAG TPA: hypothetical protein PLL78_07230 [Fimbriimonadaceae bacterium]|nr:hypothetical protein [Fimbriimonadaceae bacterium]HRJ96464.1 hypothetical protein [Fimbriimonadaceae bacterium]
MYGIAIAGLALLLLAPDERVERTLQRFEAGKPSAKSLGFFSLDWAMSLKDAKVRAKEEKRPILLILNTNITAGTNFFTGHT